MQNNLAHAGFGRIRRHWESMVLFSIYAHSAAIERGQAAVQKVMPSIAAVLAELRGVTQPEKRVCITFITRK